MVWGEFPSWGMDYSDTKCLGQFLLEWEEVVIRDFNHPSIITWCPLNEVWGDWEDPRKKRDVKCVDLIYTFTKTLDSTRPVVDVSGGHHGKDTDIFDFHCYEPVNKLKDYLDRIEKEDIVDMPLLNCVGERSSYRKGTPLNFSECGGISFGYEGADVETETVNECAVQNENAWGYGKGAPDCDAFVKRYQELIELIYSYDKLSGFCYTQLYDIEQEQNGFYYYDRTDKLTEKQKNLIRQINNRKG
jgi:beta-galactosidase/beta-glucuronidase